MDGLHVGDPPDLRLYSGLSLNYRQRPPVFYVVYRGELADISAQNALERKENSHVGIAIPLGAQYRLSDQPRYMRSQNF